MAKMQIVGVRESAGVYEGHNYNNLVLHCVSSPDDKTFGNPVEVVKVALVKAGSLLEKADGNIANLVGLSIDPVYDRNSKVDRVFICE